MFAHNGLNIRAFATYLLVAGDTLGDTLFETVFGFSYESAVGAGLAAVHEVSLNLFHFTALVPETKC